METLNRIGMNYLVELHTGSTYRVIQAPPFNPVQTEESSCYVLLRTLITLRIPLMHQSLVSLVTQIHKTKVTLIIQWT